MIAAVLIPFAVAAQPPRTAQGVELTWTTDAPEFVLETTPSLTSPVKWQSITSDTSAFGGLDHYIVTPLSFF